MRKIQLTDFLGRMRRQLTGQRGQSAARRGHHRSLLGAEILETRQLLTVVSPGGPDSIGLWTDPLELSAGDTLQISLGGAAGDQYDRVEITDSAQFGGTLEVNVLDGFDPAIGTTFEIVSSVGSTGVFDTLTLPDNLADGKRLVPVLAPSGLTLVVAAFDRPTGGSQLRLPDVSLLDDLTSFLADQTPTLTLSNVELSVFGQEIHGSFQFGVGLLDGVPVVTASASDVSASFGDGLVELSDGAATFFLMPSGVAGSASVQLSVGVGLAVSLDGAFRLAVNTTSVPVSGSVTVGGQELSLDVLAGPYVRVEASAVTLTVGSQEFTGNFLLESLTVMEDMLPVGIVRAGATEVEGLLGSDSVGVQISQGQGGFILRPTGIAAQFSGDVALVGVTDDLQLSGSVVARFNNTGIAVEETFTTSAGEEIVIDFSDTGTAQVLEFGGVLDLSIADFVDVRGAFVIHKEVSATETKLLVGASNVHVGIDLDGVGFELSDGRFGLVVVKPTNEVSTYALHASGTVSVYGLPLVASGTMGLRLRTTAGEVDETFSLPNPESGELETFELVFGADEPSRQFSGTNVTLGIPDLFVVGGDISVALSDSPTGPATVEVANPVLALYSDGEEQLRIGAEASATFEIGGEVNGEKQGFKLVSFDIAGFDFDPTDSGSDADGVPDRPTQAGTKLGPLTITNPSIEIESFELQAFDVHTGTFPLDITIGVNVEAASLKLGPFEASAEEIAGTFGIGVDLSLVSPYVSHVRLSQEWDLSIGQIDIKLGNFLEFGATDLAIDPSATGDELLVEFGSVSAGLNLSVLSIDASIQYFGITADGEFVATRDYLYASAAVNTRIGPLNVSGSVTDLAIDLDLLAQGKFPVVDVGSVALHVAGPAFGGTLSGDLLLGVVKLDVDQEIIEPGDVDSVVADRVFYVAAAAAFSLPGARQGLSIRFGISENGPLAAYLKADVDIDVGGGLVLSQVRGGVFFDAAPLPAITNPKELVSPVFARMADMNAQQWEAMLRQQIARQQGGGSFGYLFDLSATTELSDDLDGGSITAALRAEILAKGLVVREGSPIETLEQGQRWVIRDGSAALLVENRTKSLAVSRMLLTLDENQKSLLVDGPVPTEVAEAFAAAGYPVDSGIITTITPEERWEIIDGEHTFVIVDHGGVLSVTARGDLGQLEKVVRIEAGATVYHRSIPKEILNGTTDVIITTDGKFVLRADAELLRGVQKASVIFYADLSNVNLTDDERETAALLVYGKMPIQELQNLAYREFWGSVLIEELPEETVNGETFNPVELKINGGVGMSFAPPAVPGTSQIPANLLTVTVTGDITFLIRPDNLVIDAYADVSVSGLIDIPEAINGAAYFVINPTGVWGAAEIGMNIEQLQTVGLDIDGEGVLQFNSTSEEKSVPLRNSASDSNSRTEITLAPETVEAYATGFLKLKVEGVQLAKIEGAVALQINANGLKSYVAGNMAIGPDGSTSPLQAQVIGAMFISEDGFAAHLDAASAINGGLFTSNLNLDVFINTTSREQSYELSARLVEWLDEHSPALLANVTPDRTVIVPASAPRRDGSSGNPSPYFVFQGDGQLSLVGGAATVDSTFFISVDQNEYTVDVAGRLDFGPLQGTARGLVHVVFDDGVAFQLVVNTGLRLGNELTFEGTAFLRYSSLANDYQGISANTSLFLDVQGDLKLTDSFTVHGHFTLDDTPNSIRVNIDGTVDFFDTNLGIAADATIFKGPTAGLALDAVATLNGALFGVSDVFTASGTFDVHFDTRTDSFKIGVSDARIAVLEALELRGDGFVESRDGVLVVSVNMGADFLSGLAHLSARGFVSSEGEFLFDLQGEVNLGGGGFGVFGRGGLTVSYLDSNGTELNGNQDKQIYVRGQVDAQVKAFGVTLVGAGLDIEYNQSLAELGITASVTIVDIVLSQHFTVGYLRKPFDPNLAQIDGRTLVLNAGAAAGSGGRVFDSETNEGYYIHQDSNSVYVSAFGITEKFSVGSFDRLSANFGDGRDYLEISPSVTKDVDVTMGDDAVFLHNGTGDAKVSAGKNSRLLLNGGNEIGAYTYNVHANAGTVIDARNSRGGVSAIIHSSDTDARTEFYGSSKNDLVDAGQSSTPVLLYGNDGQDHLSAGGGNDFIDGGLGNDTINGLSGDDVIFGGAGNDDLAGGLGRDAISGADGDDRITGDRGDGILDGGAGTNDLLFNTAANGAVEITARSSAVQINGDETPFSSFSTISFALGSEADRLTIDGVNLPLPSIHTGDGDDAVTIQSLVTTQTVNVDLGRGDDTLTVLQTNAPLNVNGQGHLTRDILRIDRSATAQPLVGSLSDTQILGLGLAPIDYSGFESIEIELGQGADQFNVSSTNGSAVTQVHGRGDADQFVVTGSQSLAGPITLNGGDQGGNNDSSSDTLTIHINGNAASLPATTFANLTFAVDQLVVDNSTSTTATDWLVKDRQVFAPASAQVPLLDGAGADTVRILGGANATLNVTDSLPRPKQILIAGEAVQIEQGANVLSYADTTPPLGLEFRNGPNVTRTTEIISTTHSPDGKNLYVLARFLELDQIFTYEHLLTYTIDARTGEAYFIQDIENIANVDSGAGQLSVSPDGNFLYLGDLLAIRRDPVDGRLGQFPGIAIGANGEIVNRVIVGHQAVVVVKEPGSLFVQHPPRLLTYDINPLTGEYYQTPPITYTINLTGDPQEDFDPQSLVADSAGNLHMVGTLTTNLDGQITPRGVSTQVLVDFTRGATGNITGLSVALSNPNGYFGTFIRDPKRSDISPDERYLYRVEPQFNSFNQTADLKVFAITTDAESSLYGWGTASSDPIQVVAVINGTNVVRLDVDVEVADDRVTLHYNNLQWRDASPHIQSSGPRLEVFARDPNTGLVPGPIAYDTATSTLIGTVQTLDPSGPPVNRSLTSVRFPVISGDYVYGLSPDQSALMTFARGDIDAGTQFVPQIYPITAGLQNASSLAVTSDGQFLYVSSPSHDTITTFRIGTNPNPSFVRSVAVSTGFAPQLLRVIGNQLYVLGSSPNSVKVFTIDGSGTLTAAPDLPGSFGVAQDVVMVGTAIYVSGSAGVEHINGSLSPIANGAGDLTASLDGQTLFVARPADAAIDLFDIAVDGSLSRRQTLQNGTAGIVGLMGVSSLTLDSAGQYLVAVGTDADSLVVFARDPSFGVWFRADRLRQGFDGANGLTHPNSVLFDAISQQFLVSSDGRGPSLGGLSRFNILPPPSDPVFYTVEHEGMSSLTVQSDVGSDSVRVRDAEVSELTVNTDAGSDSVVVLSTLSGSHTVVNLGEDDDTFELRTTGAGSTVTVNGGNGGDNFRVFSQSLGANSTVTVHGDDPTTFPGDSLLVDVATDLTGSSGTLALTNDRTIAYTGIEVPSRPVVTFTIDAGSPSVAEGNVLSLSASATGGSGLLSYAWDLDGDGLFGEATGASALVPWAMLQGLGLGDDGDYPIAVMVSDSLGNSGVASSVLRITNTAPILAVIASAASVDAGSPLTLTLSSTDPGNDRVSQWSVNWGDGVVETFAAGTSSTSVSHVYSPTTPTNFHISVRGLDEDVATPGDVNSWYGPVVAAVTVTIPVPTIRSISGATSVQEGESLTLSLLATGPGISGLTDWLIGWGDGSQTVASGSSATHTFATPGDYTISAFTRESTGLHAAGSVSLTVTDIAPVLTISGSSSVDRGRAYTLGLAAGAGLNGPVRWTVAWGDGSADTFDSANGNRRDVQHVYAFQTQPYVIRVTATDLVNSYIAAGPTVTVNDVAPQPSAELLNPNRINQAGDGIAVQFSTNDPAQRFVDYWLINWGDGSTEQVPGETGVLINDNGTRTIVAVTLQTVSHEYLYGRRLPYQVQATAVVEGMAFSASPLSVLVGGRFAPLELTVADAAVSVSEGATATNSGTWSDTGVPITLSASVGNVVLNANGTWTWNLATTDGPNESQVVTITARDADGHRLDDVVFQLTINNVDVVYEAGGDETLLPPVVGAFNRGPISFTDPGTDVWSGTVNYGDPGAVNQALSVNQINKQFGLSHVYTTQGTFVVTVTLQDDDGNPVVDTFQVTVTLNTPPVAKPDDVATDEDHSATFNVLADNRHGADSDAQNNIVPSLTVALSSPSAGLLTDNGNGNFAFNPNGQFEYLAAGQSTTVSFNYKVFDSYGASDIGTATITINGVNDAATLSANTRNLTETNSAVDISSSGTLSISDVDSPATFVPQASTVGRYGSFTLGTNGAWTYTASSAHNEFVAGVTYTDTFAVASADGTTTSVTINILGVNDAAVLSADTRNLTETNSAADISSSGTLSISDVDSPATFVAQASTVGRYGSFTLGSNGAWTYTASSAHNEFVAGVTYTDTFAARSADGTTTSVTINTLGTNDAPVLTGLTNSSPDCGDARHGETMSVSGSFTDLDATDTHAVLVQWGDGTQSYATVSEANGTFTANHAFATGGYFTITATVADNHSGTAVGTTTTTIGGVGLHNGVLQIIGTDGRDVIHVSRHGSTIRVDARFDVRWRDHGDDRDQSDDDDNEDDDDGWEHNARHEHSVFNAASVTSILIQACDGNDRIHIGQGITLPSIIDGGAGNDFIWSGSGNDAITDLIGNNHIHSGAGNDVIITGTGSDQIWTDGGNDTVSSGDGADDISTGDGDDLVFAGGGSDTVNAGDGNDIVLGGDGNDDIAGGKGRDLLIGGNGADTLKGNDQDDILIAGFTSYDNNAAALGRLLAEWTSTGAYAIRVNNLRTGGGLTGGSKLIGDDGATQTVFNDNDVDVLDGNKDLDLFWANLVADNGGAIDTVKSDSGETKLDTDF